MRNIFFLLLIAIVSSCNTAAPKIDGATQLDNTPSIFPQYDSVCIPPNIAPLNFLIDEEGVGYYVKIDGEKSDPVHISQKSAKINIPIKKWKKLLENNRGGKISLSVYVKSKSGEWKQYSPMQIFIANHEIDNTLVYRIINVGYILWNRMGIYQRNLQNFDEKPIMLNRNSDGNCMNCHSFSSNRPDYFMFHMRGQYGGTIISTPDSTFKINTKTDYTLAAGAYPAWHPGGKYIAYSVNTIRQFFHSVSKDNEVFDKASDIIIYDIEKDMVLTHPSVATRQRESLPNWSPDGKHLYFCRAASFYDTLAYNEVQYDLLRIAFDTQTNTWGEIDTVLMASQIGGTITFPRMSPDGKYMLFTTASHGYFTIYNRTSDLKLYDFENDTIIDYPYNSNTVDSYHQWSSNGRWIVFSSKRIDDLTTRPFISYIDEKGQAYRPFVLPQKDPAFYKTFALNYNRPELVKESVDLKNRKLFDAVKSDAANVQFDTNIDVDALTGATEAEKIQSLH